MILTAIMIFKKSFKLHQSSVSSTKNFNHNSGITICDLLHYADQVNNVTPLTFLSQLNTIAQHCLLLVKASAFVFWAVPQHTHQATIPPSQVNCIVAQNE